MITRAQHYSNKSKHAQREFLQEKPVLKPVGYDTRWVGEFVLSVEGLTTWFTTESIIALPLGHTSAEREQNLRKASSMGVLQMQAYCVDGAFVCFRWRVA